MALAAVHPDIFAYSIMKSAGYMAVIGGEVAHIIGCTPISVKIRHSEGCYRELPVSYQKIGQKVFLLKEPRTKLGDQYTGPHQILEVLPKNNVKISHKKGCKIVHKDKLKIAQK